MDFDEKLINVILKYPIVWNRKLRAFRNKGIKENTWKLIADEMNTTVENVQKRYTYLRERNRKEKNYEDSPNVTTEREPWHLREKCRFLDEVQLKRNGVYMHEIQNSFVRDDETDTNYDVFSMDSFTESSSVKCRRIDQKLTENKDEENRNSLDGDFNGQNSSTTDGTSPFGSYVNSLIKPLPVQVQDELQTNIIALIMVERRKYL